MHEAAVMQDLMAELGRVAAGAGGARIRTVRVWLGALSHFTPGHFREHFETEAAGGPAAGAAILCECSDDIVHDDAGGVRLLSVEIEDDRHA